jgi:hypothetical protein
MAYDKTEKASLLERLDRWSMPEPNTGCYIWFGGSYSNYGHGMIGVKRAGAKTRMMMSHRLAWELHKGPIPDGLNVLHHCDMKGCVNPEHLFLGTHQDNMDDKVRKGRQAKGDKLAHPRAKGERNGNSRLTLDEVLAIREMEGPQRPIAAKFGVTQALVSKIKRKEVWAHA